MIDLFGDEELKALSWKEPFASAMLYDKTETRTWKTNYRGLVLICASKEPYSTRKVLEISGIKQGERIADLWLEKGLDFHNCGHAIAVGRLVDCWKMRPSDENACFVQWTPDLFCHQYEDVRAIHPFLWHGGLGFMNVSAEIRSGIYYKENEKPHMQNLWPSL